MSFLFGIMCFSNFTIIYIFNQLLMIIYDLFAIMLLIVVINERSSFGFALLVIIFDFLM